MIHSLAGGSFREKRLEDFALVEITEGIHKGKKFWYLTGGLNLIINTKVLVPLREFRVRGVVVRVDNKKMEGQTPVPISQAKKIIKILEE